MIIIIILWAAPPPTSVGPTRSPAEGPYLTLNELLSSVGT